jgi:hypothetical protein
MKAKVKASLYVAKWSRIYKVGDVVEVDEGTMHEYPGYFEPEEEMKAKKLQTAPENKMMTAAKETVKEPAKRGRKKSG